MTAIDGVTVLKPEGAFYLCAGLPVDDAQSFAEFLLENFDVDGETTMIAPADGFYATPGMGRNEARIAYENARRAYVESLSGGELEAPSWPQRRELAAFLFCPLLVRCEPLPMDCLVCLDSW